MFASKRDFICCLWVSGTKYFIVGLIILSLRKAHVKIVKPRYYSVWYSLPCVELMNVHWGVGLGLKAGAIELKLGNRQVCKMFLRRVVF